MPKQVQSLWLKHSNDPVVTKCDPEAVQISLWDSSGLLTAGSELVRVQPSTHIRQIKKKKANKENGNNTVKK